MDLVLDKHYKYDEWGRYYYLTHVGAELVTGFDDLDSVWKKVENRLKRQGQLLKVMMMLCNNNDLRPRYSRKDFIEYVQYKDENEERKNIQYMLSEIAVWAYEIDGDIMAYEERNPKDVFKMLPMTVRETGNRTGLIFTGTTSFVVPEDEYQVGY